MERFGNLAQWGERLKESGVQMGRMVSEKMKDIIQTPTLESKIVDEATLERMEEPNWGLNLRICAMINREELRGPEVVRAMKRKISSGNPICQNLALDLLETCTMNCEKVFSEVASERVLDEMVRMIDNPQTEQGNRDKALQMISAWGQSENLDYLPVFRQTYIGLKSRRVGQNPDGSSFPEQYTLESYMHQEPSSHPEPEGYPFPEMGIQGVVPLSQEEKKEILVETRNSVDLLSSMINAETGQISVEEFELRETMLEKCKQSEPMIQGIIETTTDDECVLFEALSLNDELQQIISKFTEVEVSSEEPEKKDATTATSESENLDRETRASASSKDTKTTESDSTETSSGEQKQIQPQPQHG